MINLNLWKSAVENSEKLALDGNSNEGLNILLATAGNPPTNSQLSFIFKYCAKYTLSAKVIELVKIYANKPSDTPRSGLLCNAWAIELLRKNHNFSELLTLVNRLSIHEMDHRLFYIHLSNAMHDENLFNSIAADDQNLLRAFKISIEQKSANKTETYSEFVRQSCIISKFQPEVYKRLIKKHHTLMNSIDANLAKGKNVFLLRFLLGQDVDACSFIAELNNSSPGDLNSIFSLNNNRFIHYVTLWAESKDITVELTPSLVLFFEKIKMKNINHQILEHVIESWIYM